MTQPSRYRGLPVSEGMAAGQLYPGDTPAGTLPATPEQVAGAFAAVARERSALAQQLREGGRGEEADIVAVGALIAADPALVDPAVAAARDGADAAAAVERSAAAQATAIAALANPDLAARADDIRQVASAVLAHLAGGNAVPPPAGSFIFIRREVDPADLIRLADAGLAGAVSVSGGANSHAAIIARGLGIPMLAGADPAVLTAPAGHSAILDAVDGRLIVDPSPQELAAVAGLPAQPWAAGAAGAGGLAGRDGAMPAPVAPLRTADGQEITLLCNVASATETRLGVASGATGVGLLRTEIPFINATEWPSESDHRRALDPVLDLLNGRPAVVRLLDFSGDKIPAFLAGRRSRPGRAARPSPRPGRSAPCGAAQRPGYPAGRHGTDGEHPGGDDPRAVGAGGRRCPGRRRRARAGDDGGSRRHRFRGGRVRRRGLLLLDRHQRPDQPGARPGPGRSGDASRPGSRPAGAGPDLPGGAGGGGGRSGRLGLR